MRSLTHVTRIYSSGKLGRYPKEREEEKSGTPDPHYNVQSMGLLQAEI
jgi:hypothetical protein